jgi:hypothetical protein
MHCDFPPPYQLDPSRDELLNKLVHLSFHLLACPIYEKVTAINCITIGLLQNFCIFRNEHNLVFQAHLENFLDTADDIFLLKGLLCFTKLIRTLFKPRQMIHVIATKATPSNNAIFQEMLVTFKPAFLLATKQHKPHPKPASLALLHDLVLVVETREFPVHWYVCIAWSDFFESHLRFHGKTSKVTLNIDPLLLTKVVSFMYSSDMHGTCSVVLGLDDATPYLEPKKEVGVKDLQQAFRLFTAADFLGVKELLCQIEFMLCKNLTLHTISEIYSSIYIMDKHPHLELITRMCHDLAFEHMFTLRSNTVLVAEAIGSVVSDDVVEFVENILEKVK